MAVVAVVEVIQGSRPVLAGIPRTGLHVGRADPSSALANTDLGLALEDPSVSKRHARFFWQGDDVLVEDLGSTNKIHRDGELLDEPTLLADGDELVLGEVVLRVIINGDAPGRPVGELLDTQRTLEPRTQGSQPVDIERRAAEILPVVESFLHAKDFADLGRRIAQAVKKALGVSRAAVIEVEEGSQTYRVLGVAGAPSASFVSGNVVTDVLKRGVTLHQLGAVGRPTAPSLLHAGASSAIAAVIRSPGPRTRIVYADGLTVESVVLTWRHALELQLFAATAASVFESIHTHRIATQERLKFENLRRYFSPSVVEQLALLSRPAEEVLAPVYTDATVLFADFGGLTTLVGKWGGRPETVVSILDLWFELGTRAVFSHKGTLDKYVGDTIMAVFGAPFHVPEASLQAVRCALEMQEAVTRLAQETGESLAVTVGINSGSVLACAPGSRRRREFTVLGETVGIAARLQERAEPGQILLGPTTASEVSHAVELEAGAELMLGHRTEPVTSWRVVRLR